MGNQQGILDRINGIFQDAFDDESLTVSNETTAQDIEGWDSLMHLSIIEMIEGEFGIKFTMEEIMDMENVGAMIKAIETHTK